MVRQGTANPVVEIMKGDELEGAQLRGTLCQLSNLGFCHGVSALRGPC